MELQELIEFARRVAAAAATAGAQQAEAWVESGRQFSVRVRDGAIEDITQATSKGVGLRAYVGQRLGFATSTDFTDGAIERMTEQAVAMAREVSDDPNHGLPEPADLERRNAPLELYDPAVDALEPPRRIEAAIEMERIAREFDPRIVNIDEVSTGDNAGAAAFANSLGFADGYRATIAWLSCAPVARAGEEQQVDWYDSTQAFLDQLETPRAVAEEAARRVLARLGADKIESAELPVVFSPEVSLRLAYDVAAALNGDRVFKKASFLGDKLNQRVASPLFTLADDPTLPRRPGSAPFDGEGVATRRNVLFQGGELRTFLYDCYTGRKAGCKTTASALRSYASLPGIGTHQLVLQPGTTPFAGLLAGIERGLYVTRLMGGQANPVNGDYSRGAAGTLIERGKLTSPVQEITLAGNMLQMLADIDAVSDELRWFGSGAAPALRLRRLAISGK